MREWAARFGLVAGADEEDRLGLMGHGRMAGFVAPRADPAELGLLAQWGAFVAVVDDGFDRDDRSGHVLEQLLSVLSSDEQPEESAALALADLWRRSAHTADPRWRARFVDHFAQFAAATGRESALRASGTRLGLADYVELRRLTITVLPMLDLVERALPSKDETLDVFREAAADTVAWTNDLASAERELAAGQENLVSVVARERACDLYEAAAIARAMIDRRMDDFDACEAALLGSGPWQAGLAPRVALIRTFRDGALAWQAETRRNRTETVDGFSPSPSRPVTHTGGTAAQPRQAVDRLARHLVLAVAPGGAITDRCGSRVLESALALALLRAAGSYEVRRRELSRYLHARRRDADPIEALLIDACLDPVATRGGANAAVATLSGTLARGAGGRRQLKTGMLCAVLHILCGSRLNANDIPPPAPADRISTFTDVNLLATRIIYAHATGHPHEVSATEHEHLIDSLRSGRDRLLWEASAATHLLGLHAVRMFRPSASIVVDGTLGATLAQNPDGGLPFLDSQDVWLAAVAGPAFLADAGLRPLTVRMAAFVASWQAPDGGWPFASGMTQTDVDSASRCVEFLQALDPAKYRRQLKAGRRYLAAMADADGGFPTWVSADAPDLDMTAGAVIALAPDWYQHQRLLSRSVDFILDAQQPDGTFERSWTISESSGILRALDALHAMPDPGPDVAGRITTAAARAVARLTATQNDDGGWGQHAARPSDVLSTAQALPVLVRHAQHRSACRAVDYLLARQDPDGGFTSIPDQVGPRPLPFDFPVLVDIHTLSALHSAVRLPAQARRTRTDWSALVTRMQGTLLGPSDIDYDHARRLINQRYEAVRPQAVALPATTRDVVECVNFVRERGIPLAIRCGGHSYAGYSTGPGLVINVASLSSSSVHDGRAHFGAGAQGLAAHRALAAAGAGLPLGRCPTIGLTGATLGGGMSGFTRAWGLAIDRLRGAEIVTADGVVRQASAESDDADLFWALCGGGGGNFGVVTALEFDTVDIGGLAFTNFMLSWPYRDLEALIRGWQSWSVDPGTPRELRSAIEQLSGAGPWQPTVTGTFIGRPCSLEPLLDRLVDAVGTPPGRRSVRPCGYVEAAVETERWAGEHGTWGARIAFAAKSHIVRRPMSHAATSDLVEAVGRLHGMGPDGDTGASGLLIEAIDGAVADRAADVTAFPHRGATAVIQYHSLWGPRTANHYVEQRRDWLRATHAVMQTHLGSGGYVNGMDPELADWQSAYHGSNYPRLQQVKAAYDPGQLFTFPQAITPAPRRRTGLTTSPLNISRSA